MTELSTLGAVIKTAYENQSNTNAFTDTEKQKLGSLAAVATTGSFTDLINVPDLVELDESGTIPLEYLNVSNLSFMGAWDAGTNTPVLVDGTGSTGDFYKVSNPGTFNFGNGDYTFAIGDWVMFAGGVWQRIGVHETVTSVNGKIGTVVLSASDVGAKPSTYVPTYAEITGKPDFANLYIPKIAINTASGVAPLNADKKIPIENLLTNAIGGVPVLDSNNRISSSQLYRNSTNGVAGTDADGRVALAQLPTFIPQRARSWRDVKASRNVGTNYNNTSGNDMHIHLRATSSTSVDRYLRVVVYNSVNSGGTNFVIRSDAFSATGTRWLHLNVVVPAGGSYTLFGDGGTTNTTIETWYEMS